MSNSTVRNTVRMLILAAGLVALAAPAGAADGVLSWLHGERVQGSGKVVKQNREVGHFTAIAISVPGNVDIRLGNSEGVSIETDDNLLPLIETVVDGGTLRIRPVKKNQGLDTRNLRIVVQAKALEKLAVAGSAQVNADSLRGPAVQLDVGGSGNITARSVEAASVTVALGGSGNLRVSGNTDTLKVSIGGSGRVEAGQLAAREAAVSIGGSGQATVWAKQSLNLSLAGSGDIAYYGDPQVSKSVAGSGSIKRLGGAPQ